ncbi:MAG TPA: formylglycine-generating enzyme family protein [Planctomycetota bacterium]|nr:formylglycine-generating enzyme family protein [Planctomycetota bacterium]
MRLRVCLIAIALFCAGCSSGSKSGRRVDYSSTQRDRVIASSDSAKLNGTCPPGMVLIPAGQMLYGPNEERDVKPTAKDVAQRISVKAFCIDKYEYPNEPGEAPMRSVSWIEAGKLCGDRGKRLCSEYEFEKACRGPAGTVYTYGDGYAEKVCPKAAENYGLGQFSNCVSGFDVYDMGGGVFEWTSSSVGDNPKADLRILRGGMNEDGGEQNSKCTYRTRFAAAQQTRDVGFRCCAAPTKEEIGK